MSNVMPARLGSRPRALLALVACAAVFSAFARPADELAFRPAAGAKAAKKCAIEIELAVRDFALRINGEPAPKKTAEGLGELSALLHLDAQVTDTYVKSAGGRPLELTRAYETLRLRGETGDRSRTETDLDTFVGETVRFVWDEEKQAYAKSLVEVEATRVDVDATRVGLDATRVGLDATRVGAEAKDEALAGLSEDMDARGLLPARPVAVGDTWKVSGDALAALFVPGGLFGLDARGGADAEMRAFLGQLARGARGLTVECTYTGAREEAGRTLAKIAFTFDGDTAFDVLGLAQSIAPDVSEAAHGLAVEAQLHLDGKGALEWDVAAGRAHALAFESALELRVDVRAEIEQEGRPKFALDAHVVAGGKGSWELAVK